MGRHHFRRLNQVPSLQGAISAGDPILNPDRVYISSNFFFFFFSFFICMGMVTEEATKSPKIVPGKTWTRAFLLSS